MEQRRGLLVYFYRAAAFSNDDASNGGISARYDKAVVVGAVRYRNGRPHNEELPEYYQVFQPDDLDKPAVWLVCDRFGDGDRYLIPAGADGGPDRRHLMYGGNLVGGADSRWLELVDSQYGVRVHDRFEGGER